jgi:quercetin dioxygenase-like cupin family protein
MRGARMIVRSFFEAEGELKPSHEGTGLVKQVDLFAHEDFDTNLSFIIYCEIEPGRSIGYHQHGENEEVYAILDGAGLMRVNGQVQEVKAGDVILNKPGWSHGLENNSSEPLKVFVFEVVK